MSRSIKNLSEAINTYTHVSISLYLCVRPCVCVGLFLSLSSVRMSVSISFCLFFSSRPIPGCVSLFLFLSLSPSHTRLLPMKIFARISVNFSQSLSPSLNMILMHDTTDYWSITQGSNNEHWPHHEYLARSRSVSVLSNRLWLIFIKCLQSVYSISWRFSTQQAALSMWLLLHPFIACPSLLGCWYDVL